MNTLEQTVHDIVRTGFRHAFGHPATPAREDDEWRRLRSTGTRLWLDTGDIDEAAALWAAPFDALTTNNTLLNKEIQKGPYDGLIRGTAAALRRAAPGLGEAETVLEIAFVLNAFHGLRLVERFDAFVSVELHTDLAHDVARTVAYGKRFFAVCPERFIVKVPLTAAGLLGARRLVQAGIPINFTLGFSARQNYLAALLARPTYVNVFMGRLNAFVADHKLGSGENVGEKATLATQRELLALRQGGRTGTLLIGASIRSGPQIGALAGLDVLTMPPKAAAEYRRTPRPAVTSQIAQDPAVPLAAGVTLDQFNGRSLWDVSARLKESIEALLVRDADRLTPDDIQAHLEAAGHGDLMPRWSGSDVQTARRDGKIPVYATWRDRLAAGRVGLDALMNLSALQSFATDQAALDARIRSLL